MTEANTKHPDAQDELEEFEEYAEEERERLTSGKLKLPWPRSAGKLAFVGLTAIGAAGATAVMASAQDIDLLLVIATVLLTSGIANLAISKWFYRHFRTGPEPRYPDDDG